MRARRCLFFGGGGFRTLGFIGALEALGWGKGWTTPQEACGLSAGAILALHLVLGYNVEGIKQSFLDHEKLIFDGLDLGALCKGRAPLNLALVRKAIKKILLRKGFGAGTTLRDLSERRSMRFSTLALCLDSCRIVRFGLDNTPDLSVVDAVAASVAIPLIFDHVLIGGQRYVDAGLINSVPLSIFDARSTLAFVVRSCPTLGASPLPETVHLRCQFLASMAVQTAMEQGMHVLHVAHLKPVSLLSRGNVRFSESFALGMVCCVLSIMTVELLGFLCVVCSPCCSGGSQSAGPTLSCAATCSTSSGTLG